MASPSSSSPSTAWTPDSWRSKPIVQQPDYSSHDPAFVESVMAKIRSLPPLVYPAEVDSLRAQLAAAGRGEAFILQGGDCAERFDDCRTASIEAKLKILLQMSLVLLHGSRRKVVRIGRIGGQWSKPRSSPVEVVDGVEMPSFKGDSINQFEATLEARQHDPSRLLEAHFHSACTVNYLRALIKGGAADLHHARHWDLGYVKDSSRRSEYESIVERILDSLDFMRSIGSSDTHSTETIDFFTSHEGLVLDYEAAMTEQNESGCYYDTSAHMLWIGNRTRQLDHAHVEYHRGIANPVGVKVGPGMEGDELLDLIRTLNPDNEEGKVVLISRVGAGREAETLTPLINAVKESEVNVVWICDPCHGNTHKTESGIKTRAFDSILSELINTYELHARLGSHLAGVHLELTGERVTECVGGGEQLAADDLHLNYTSYCDPRLNQLQSLEIAFRLAQLLEAARLDGRATPLATTPAP